MKRSSIIFVLLLCGLCASAAEPTDHPIGIDAKDWIPITEKFGFVVVTTAEPSMPRVQGRNPQILLNEVAPELPATGYFMIRTEKGWRRLVVMTAAEIAAASKD